MSYQTVSKVLNKQIQVSKETEARIHHAVAKLGYRPNQIARNMRLGRTHMIGYSWAPAPDGQVNSILDRFLQSMAQEAENRNYHVVLYPHRTGQELLDLYDYLIGTNQVDAFVISNVEFNDQRILHLKKRKFPFVAFGRSNPEIDFPYVDVDGGRGMHSLIQHLVSLGHRKVGVLAWPEDSRVGSNRLDGLLEGVKEAGIDLPPHLLLRGDGNTQFGKSATRHLIGLPQNIRPTAIIGFNDFMAIGAIQAIQERGFRIPDDFAVVGFDDNPISQFVTPSLTSINQPVNEVGRRIISLLVDLLETDDPGQIPLLKRQVLIAPKLVIRASSSSPDQIPYQIGAAVNNKEVK